MDWQRHISVAPNICHGQACITGTRIPAIQACIAYAANLAGEEVVGLQREVQVDENLPGRQVRSSGDRPLTDYALPIFGTQRGLRATHGLWR